MDKFNKWYNKPIIIMKGDAIFILVSAIAVGTLIGKGL